MPVLDKVVYNVNEIIRKVNNDKVKLDENYTKIVESKTGHVIVEIAGGLNGGGDWEDYFEVLANLCKVAKEKYGKKIWVIELNNDCLDDIFYIKIGIRV